MYRGSTLLVILLLLFIPGSIALGQTNDECFDCHNDPELMSVNARGDTVSAHIDPERFLTEGVHAEMEFQCIDCHSSITELPHEDEVETGTPCAECHDDVAEEYAGSLHGYALESGNLNAPDCADCHGSHYIRSSSEQVSMTHHLNLPQTCSKCHSGYGLKQDPDIRIARAVDMYLGSVHGKNLADGEAAAATCTDCHGIHNLKGAANSESMVNHQKVPETCSKCHEDIYFQYSNSIHGKALAAGITDSPNCTDCHGEHSIKSSLDPSSPTSKIHLSEQVCADCHEDPRMIEKYGLATETVKTYSDSYHGLATRQGSAASATCVSCHNSHYILPPSNQYSTVHEDNVTETCRTCHPAADKSFSASYTHASLRSDSNIVDYWVRKIYILLIVVVVGGMIIHNVIIMSKFIREKYHFDETHNTVKRFDGHAITQHLMLTVSFIALTVTGFALKFPDAWWSEVLSVIGLNEALRALLHRIAAILLIITSIYHAIYLLGTRTGRKELGMMWFKFSDMSDVKKNLSYHLGTSDEHPEFDKYDYGEKIEYWALIWGTIVMVITGFILWFPEYFIRFLPPWAFKVAETIHYFEAWLAMLSVIVWHFFLVILHPNEYPMSLSWLHGRMTVEEARSHHKLWYERISKEKKKQKKGDS